MAHEQTLARKVTIGDWLIRGVQGYRRLHRLYFPSPAEIKFVRVMRGHALSVPFIKSRRTGFKLTLLWRGRLLKNELIEREVRVGRYYIDFATRDAAYKKALEIDGSDFHKDILAEQERDQYLQARGWTILHIKAARLKREPRRVFVDVLKFLKS